MALSPPPNSALAELATVLGEDNIRTLVRTFLRDFPASLAVLHTGDRPSRHRVAHSMKSSLRLVGALPLSQRMAELEARLSAPTGGDVTPEEFSSIGAEFELIAAPLRKFVGDDVTPPSPAARGASPSSPPAARVV